MPVAAGTRFGVYEVLAPLGAGGMGEVYRARDHSLDREVAVKVLPAHLSRDPDRLRRFEQEARAAAALNHPHILTVFQLGTDPSGSPYVVSELLEGQTLRERLNSGPLPARKAIDYAMQMASGLAAAHNKGIVHRDLKPDNLFITKEDRVKILDFGLAKLVEWEGAGSDTSAPTLESGTRPGSVMGTVGYMSPEQVRGQPADHRSDIFSFGTVLYEMLSGKRAFRHDSAVETMSAILKEDPPELVETNRSISPALEKVVRHCLEKDPNLRFQSARDVGFYLRELSGLTDISTAVAPRPEVRIRWRRWALLSATLAAVALAVWAGLQLGKAAPPAFQQLTFRRGTIHQARFSADGQTVVYSARWDGESAQVYSTRPESPESSPLALPRGNLLAISSKGDLAVTLGCRWIGLLGCVGTLATVPLSGGAPRESLQDVEWADWSPDGQQLTIVRYADGHERLEYPVGKVLVETTGLISHPRVSPKNDGVAFLEHPPRSDAGAVNFVDLSGKKTSLSGGWSTIQGLAWSPDGRELWFTGTRSGSVRALYAVTRGGQERLILREAANLTLHDVARDGRVLLSHDLTRLGVLGLRSGETHERDLSWFDWSIVEDISEDGSWFVFAESGEAVRGEPVMYKRDMDGSPAVRLGPGRADRISPDGKWLLARTLAVPSQLVRIPRGPGETQPVTSDEIDHLRAGWSPDGKQVVFSGIEPGGRRRSYIQAVEGGKPRPITPEGYSGRILSPDGMHLLAYSSSKRSDDIKVLLFPVDGGEPKPVLGILENEEEAGWSADGRLIVFQANQVPSKVFLVDTATGRRELWKELKPGDPSGVLGLYGFRSSRSGSAYVYGYMRILSDLYLVDGLK
ncbi:MAG TPA: protein kinase [Terriglobales bacterium]|nr:protein kinase [Terriglobales bacterium]